MSNENNSSNVGGIITAFAVGALVGAGLALLYAPQSGRETRELIAEKTRNLRDKAGDALDEAQEMIRGKKAQVIAAVEAGRDAMEEEAERQRKS